MKKKKFDGLLRIMQSLDDTVTSEEQQKIFQPIIKETNFIFKSYACCVMSAYSFLVLQVIVAPPEKRIWPSTFPYPFEFMHQPTIYWGGLIFQAASNSFHVTFDIAADTYGAVLLNVLNGHISLLGMRMRNMDDNMQKTNDPQEQKRLLINYCQRYILILRFDASVNRKNS